MADDQLRIRLLAYRIWEAEGCPDGEAERHWHMACRMVAAERITDVPQEAQPRPAPRSKKTAEPVATAANVQEAPEATDEAAPKKPAAKRTSTAKRRSSSAEGKAGESKTTGAKTTASKSTTTRKTTAAKKGSTAKSDTTTTRKRNSSSNDDKSDQ